MTKYNRKNDTADKYTSQLQSLHSSHCNAPDGRYGNLPRRLVTICLVMLSLLLVTSCSDTRQDEEHSQSEPTEVSESAPTATATEESTPVPTEAEPTPTLPPEAIRTPEPTVEPISQVPSDWVNYENSDAGYSIMHPPDWLVYEGTDGGVSLASEEILSAAGRIIPAGAITISILPGMEPMPEDGEKIVVGREDYPGSLVAGGTDQTMYFIDYEVEQTLWRLVAHFGGVVSENDYYSETFNAMIESLEHWDSGIVADGADDDFDSPSEPIVTYEWAQTWDGFIAPTGIAVDGAHRVYVADMDADALFQFSPDGAMVDQASVRAPLGVDAADMGEGSFVFVAQREHGSIATVTHERGRIMEWNCGTPNAGSSETRWCYPTDVAFYRPGHSPLFISTPTEIHDFVISGDYYETVYESDGYQHWQGLAIDHELNRIYVAQRQSGTVLVVDLVEGMIIDQWPFFDQPNGIAVDHLGNVFVAEMRQAEVVMLSPSGKSLGSLGAPGTGEGEFVRPFDVAVDDMGNVYVTDIGDGRVQVFSPYNGQ